MKKNINFLIAFIESLFLFQKEKKIYQKNKKKNEKLNELYLVGKTKSVGYLSVLTLKACGKTTKEMLVYAEENGLNYLFIKNEDNACYLGHLYFYHEYMLNEILCRGKDVLTEADVPHDSPTKYIIYIANNHVSEEKYPVAYRLIGKTFNDQRFKWKRQQ